ncbi:MAG: hypothetical protein ACYTGH_11490, partial [Planctomycetota bacterium]
MGVQIGLDFHPSYHAQNFGVDYGERYHQDPLYRIEQNHRCAQALHERYGEYGLGNPSPAVTSIGMEIQPLDFLNGAWGSVMHYSAEEHVWTTDKPLSHIDSMDALTAMPDI